MAHGLGSLTARAAVLFFLSLGPVPRSSLLGKWVFTPVLLLACEIGFSARVHHERLRQDLGLPFEWAALGPGWERGSHPNLTALSPFASAQLGSTPLTTWAAS